MVQDDLVKLKATVSRMEVGHSALRREFDVHKMDFGEMRKRLKTQAPAEEVGGGKRKKKGLVQQKGGPGARAGGPADTRSPGGDTE